MKDKLKLFFTKVGTYCSKASSWIYNKFFYLLSHYDFYICFVIITILSCVLRYSVFDCIRGDFTSFLKPWYKIIYENGISALGYSIGDYTPAYYYFLYFISLFKFDPESMQVLYGIKYISCIFDFLLAVFVYFIVEEITKSKHKALIAYIGVNFGITIFLNSALWGQCDSIYTAFIAMSLYYLLRGKQRKSLICYGISFSFKLQAIFVLPLYIILFLRKNLKFRYFIYIPLVYLLFALPSCIIADNFFTRLGDIMMVYVNQSANSYQQLTLNAGSLYGLIFTNFKEEEFISSFAVPLAVAILGTFIFFIYRSKEKFNNTTYVKIVTLFALAFPYLLPHMHERYFYVADVAVIVYAILNPKKVYVAICALINSLIGYMAYLWGISFIPLDGDASRSASFRFGALLYLVAIVAVSYDLFKELYPNGIEDTTKQEEQTL
ncbi:MAG: glycosyltransferase 87 family protein [Bacilli bacterium]